VSALAVLARPPAGNGVWRIPRGVSRHAFGERARAWHHERISTPPPDLSALFARVQSGDQDAFADLYDAIAPLVFGAVKRILRDPAMSEEVTQEVFVDLWTSAARFDPTRGVVSTWAVTIARRRAIDRVRSEQSQRNRIEQLGHRRADVEDGTDDAVVASLDAERVTRALADLPTDQRQIIQLAFIDGYSHSDIAEQLGLPLGTVKGRVRGGLQRLSGKLGGVV
jgi:RNA polymerase sigma-70 factor, ECF subfamily